LSDADVVEDNKWILKKISGVPLLFIWKRNEGLRVCIPESLHQDVLRIAHDNQAHAEIERTYSALRDHFYLRQMGSVVRSYVSSCPQCLTKKTVRHKPYGQLQIIEAPHRSFHTITIDFIVKLPLSKHAGDVYDTILTITDKLSRATIFVPGKETWNAPEWADVFFDKVICRWGLPIAVISDRGSIFVSEIWNAIFQRMDVKILMSTAYHPQTDGQSEATNQYLQSVLRFFVNERMDDWARYLAEAEYVINNSPNSSTKKAPNEILYGFKLRSPIDVVTSTESDAADKVAVDRMLARGDAEDSAKHAAFHIARHYNRKHKDVEFQKGSMVFLRLGSGYKMRGVPKQKLGFQRVGPFRVVDKVGRLAYKLEFPDDWRIHPVISVAQLEPAPSDPFGRTVEPPPAVEIDGDEEFEIDAILESHIRGRHKKLHYLV
jgi:hypothetical protein